MDIFESEWLLKKMDKSSKIPQEKILSLFDVLRDWINAPNIQITLSQNINYYQKLISFIEKQAKICGADSPKTFAVHLVSIAILASIEEIRRPDSGSLTNAKLVGSALLITHIRDGKKLLVNHVSIGIAASLILLGNIVLLRSEIVNSNHTWSHISKPQSLLAKSIVSAQYVADGTLSPVDKANMYDKYERLRNGICQYPEVLSIPDNDRKVYMENVVGAKLPSNAEEMKKTNLYIEKVNCYYSPFLNAIF